MATIKNRDEDEINALNTTTTAQNNLIGGAATNAAPTPVQGTPNSGWVNLDQYLKTNQGAGRQVANMATADATQAATGSNQVTDAWAIDANKRVDDKTKKDEWSALIKDKTPAQINELMSNQETKDKYSAWKNAANYTGVTDAVFDSGYQNTTATNQDAVNKIGMMNSFEGQQMALMKANQGKNYNDGMSKLDAFLSGADTSGANVYDQFRNANANHNENLRGKTAAVNAHIKTADATGAANQKSVMDSISERIARFRADSDVANTNANASNLEQFKILHSGMNPNDFVINAEGINDQATLDALNKLGGMDTLDSTSTTNTLGNKAGVDQAKLDEAYKAKGQEPVVIDQTTMPGNENSPISRTSYDPVTGITTFYYKDGRPPTTARI